MMRFFGKNSPFAITPNCSATSIGDITRPGISIDLCNGNINSHPFLISLTRASVGNFPFSFDDLWFPLPRATFRSTSLDFNLALQLDTENHLLSLTLGPSIYGDA